VRPAAPGRVPRGDPALAARLRAALSGEVLFDRFNRGLYSTDASIYQIEPVGVVVPRHETDVLRALEIANDAGVPVLARGGGSSQIGQTVGEALVVDMSRHLDRVLEFDASARRVVVEPGIALDQLNAYLRPHGLWYPVDVSTSAQATIGGMAGNNSCGTRSLHYGMMRDHVVAIDALCANGEVMRFGEETIGTGSGAGRILADKLRALGVREADEIATRFPRLMRRVGGYNIDALVPSGNRPVNFAHLLVGSEGTLGVSLKLELALSPIPKHRGLGVCHFATLRRAMEAAPALVALGPTAVELVDRAMIDLARDIAIFRPTIERYVKGTPEAILLVEFAGDDPAVAKRGLEALADAMAALGTADDLISVADAAAQRAIWEVRKAGLNILMSMKGAGKPVSFIEDCAVPLEHLADYTERLTGVFRKHGTTGTWYAHASVGCLHVRPILDVRKAADVAKMRAIAEEAFAMVREYKGSHSGEHGDGLARSEFHAAMFGERMVRNFEEVKDIFDPAGRLNPGKIVRAPKMDDRSLMRYAPGYAMPEIETALDWSEWGGFGGAVEMCNNNGTCRNLGAGVMCPSYRATKEEVHLTRGRANALRLALSGQLGPDALVAPEMREAMRLCVGCKGCRSECPTGVDMARMKIEFQHHYVRRHGLGRRERLVAHLPRYAPWAARVAAFANLRDRLPGAAWLSESLTGLSAKRPMPRWRRDVFRPRTSVGPADGHEVVLFADTFNRYFEPENLLAALDVLVRAGCRVHVPAAADGGRPLCCGRTYLATGLVDEARREARRSMAALAPFVGRGVPILGLEPSCLLTFRDEYLALLPGVAARALAAQASTLEEYLAREHASGRLRLPLTASSTKRVLVHGHCHQKALGAFDAVGAVLKLVPSLAVEPVESSCCGMAGAFGYGADTYDVSMRMAELALLPAVRKASPETVIVADGTSCRAQIAHGTGRDALHVARVLANALSPAETTAG
jgi:FAD/FMN-containing dehydrogenase/Fe-S oxidoreductase